VSQEIEGMQTDGAGGQDPEQIGGFSRRSLLSIGWIASLVSIIGPGVANIRYLFPNVLYETPTAFKLDKPANYQPDSITFIEDRKLFIFRDRHGFRAMSAVCTHLRCTTGPFGAPSSKGKASTSRCPCHGSVFDQSGNVLSGPAPRPLSFFRIGLSPDGWLQVDTQDFVASDNYFKV
jgi:cytochrome b6-f complex iron-sulfur subunit